MTNLFIPAKLRAWSLSSAVGSGKTRAAVAWMASPSTSRRNVLYVAPTVRLLRQTAENLRQAIAAQPRGIARNVNLVSGETAAGRVEADALASINSAEEFEGRVQLLTTRTLLAVLSRIRRPELWSVIADEAWEPATFTTFRLGNDVGRGWLHFTELFDVDPSQGHRIVPSSGKHGLVGELARGDLRNVGDRFSSLSEVAAAVANPAIRAELVMTKGARALVEGRSADAAALEASDGEEQGRGAVLQFASYVDPSSFAGFREVLFLSALFEETILYALWTKALGVTFARHPEFPAEMLRDTHAEQGRFLAVGHLLHRSDPASLETLKTDAVTGEGTAREAGEPESIAGRTRVIDRLVDNAAQAFGGEPFLLQTNPRFGYVEHAPTLPRAAVYVPPVAQGLNEFDHVNNVAALFVRNPNTQQLAWVRERTGMSGRQVTQAYRIHSIYQALGRCSIRKAVPTADPKVVLTAGADDAEFIHQLFPGSHWLGQVGSMPALSSLRAGGETKELGKVEQLSGVIAGFLGDLPEATVKLSSRSLKAAVEAERGQALLQILGTDVLVCGIGAKAWTRALSLACQAHRGWQRHGQSLHRLTAEHYGFPA